MTILSFKEGRSQSLSHATSGNIYASAKPFTRWWWFADSIREKDIAHQLDWLKENNFGGVEVAWVYPLYKYNNWMKPKYDTIRSRTEWLSPEWQKVVTFTKRYADSIGLGCDFTLGTSWPEGDSQVAWKDRTQVYGDTNFKQTLTFTWEFPKIGLVVNHMDRNAFKRFSDRYFDAINPALKGQTSAILCESWEIKLNGKLKLWTPGFETSFQKRFGYDVRLYMPYLDSFPDVRYDYMKLVGDYVNQEFYQPFARYCKKHQSLSRAECLGAPTDVMTTYSLVDIPESEAMLNEPNFSKIVSSSACLSKKNIVSAETFTCMYGFPRTLHQKEQTADLKMVADALFAHGVNQIFWHGMPYNPVGCDSQYFFATVHVGKSGSLAPDFAPFNEYMQKVSEAMRWGKTYSDVAVYVPFEDAVMKGPLPVELQRVWVWGEYELRYIHTPDFLKGYAPLWINGDFLRNAKYKRKNNGLHNLYNFKPDEGKKLYCGDAEFKYFYSEVKYMEYRSLKKLYRLAKKGLPVCLVNDVTEPGVNKTPQYSIVLQKLRLLPNVKKSWTEMNADKPLIEGDSIPDFWCRRDGEMFRIFFANPKCENLKYPIYSGQSFQKDTMIRKIKINILDKTYDEKLNFEPYQSLIRQYKTHHWKTKQRYQYLDIRYNPPVPIVRPKTKEKMNF